MNTLAERVSAVASAFAGREDLGVRDVEGLLLFVEAELGCREALDKPVTTVGGGMRIARAPREIYHVCASNLAVSAETSLVIGLLLGSRLVFKLPSAGLPAFQSTVAALPESLGSRVEVIREHDLERMRGADAVVVFGSDETVREIHQQCGWKQRFLGYGRKVSVGWVPSGRASARWAEKACREILAYSQSGCLSPHAYFCGGKEQADLFAGLLAEAFSGNPIPAGKPDVSVEELAMIRQARERAFARGDKVLQPAHPGECWTVVVRSGSSWEPGPGHGYVEIVPSQDMDEVFAPWQGTISSLSLALESVPGDWLAKVAAYGISRLCVMGRLQSPPLEWRHDGRPRLADLVSWVSADPVCVA